ncbi:MAG: hypothetical protein U5L45_05480 [Saprospiraceae bacterium]|nr:hypothetical protein [Saprospiraceae bacterium]
MIYKNKKFVEQSTADATLSNIYIVFNLKSRAVNDYAAFVLSNKQSE